MRLLAALVLLAPGLQAQARDIELESRPTRWRIGYDHVLIDDAPDQGLLGVHYDRLGIVPAFPPLYVGFGGYAAVEGSRGGFFLGGVTFGALWQVLPRWNIDTGVFFGAGGGSNPLPNEGWAVRPFIGVELELGLAALRAEAAFLDMDQFERAAVASVGLSFAAERLEARSARVRGAIPPEAQIAHQLRITPRYLWLQPEDGSRRATGQPLVDDLGMLGLGIDYFLTEYVFVPVEVYGGLSGDIDGFGMALAGLGLSIPVFTDRVRLEAKGLGGAGGGGNVDTGGGGVWQAMGALRTNMTPNLALEVAGGYTSFPDGALEGTTATVGISWNGRPVELTINYPRGNLLREGLSSQDTQIIGTRFVVSNKTYVPGRGAQTKSGVDLQRTINLLGIGFVQPVSSWFELTANGYLAYEGLAGGYGEGLFGAKIAWIPEEFSNFELSVGGEFGAAGGGGVDVGDGLIYSASGGLRWLFSESGSLSLEAGKTQSYTGTFNAVAYTIGLGWDLHRAFRR